MIFQTLTDLQDFIYTKIAGAFERGICVDNFDNYTLMNYVHKDNEDFRNF